MNKQVCFQHVRPLSDGAITIAYQQAVEKGRAIIKVAVSFCSVRDKFSRKIGRELAQTRLTEFGETEHDFVFSIHSKTNHNEVVTQTLSSLLSFGKYPRGMENSIRLGLMDAVSKGVK